VRVRAAGQFHAELHFSGRSLCAGNQIITLTHAELRACLPPSSGWVKGHRLGADIVYPVSGYIATAICGAYQSYHGSQHIDDASSVVKLGYWLRDVRFVKPLVLERGRAESSS
jgi:hypothetical protein